MMPPFVHKGFINSIICIPGRGLCQVHEELTKSEKWLAKIWQDSYFTTYETRSLGMLDYSLRTLKGFSTPPTQTDCFSFGYLIDFIIKKFLYCD